MYRKMEKRDLNFVNNMLGKINYSAKFIFNEAYKNKEVSSCLIYTDDNNHGVFRIINGETYYSLQMYFDEDVSNYNK
ncbi:hypothetical protein KQI36_13380 [Clostridium senegalense]|uniref:hypothetical protein n=1 Tax=Clostridium senegalense TaxID=1465809 RepID=UPI001C11CB62|nr:hypothetical protein [Clostridium senegalense]MBU5227624.1 hypothetical protein [Clostridium senegalense]